jgi:hypothetical protein
MQVQKTLDNKQLPTKEKPWTGLCCARCYRAKSDKKRCRCRCHGAHHGEQRLRVLERRKKPLQIKLVYLLRERSL